MACNKIDVLSLTRQTDIVRRCGKGGGMKMTRLKEMRNNAGATRNWRYAE
jgi:hypothetical protein